MKKKIWVWVTISAVILPVTTYFIARHKVLYHFAVVDEGKVYRSGTLSELGLRWAKDISGFKTIVNLRSKEENKLPWHQCEVVFAKNSQVKLIDMPMEPDTPPTPAQCKRFLDIFKSPDNLPVIIHCHQGVVRTAMMVAVYKIGASHEKNDSVFSIMETFGHNLEKPSRKNVKNFILQYDPDNYGDNCTFRISPS